MNPQFPFDGYVPLVDDDRIFPNDNLRKRRKFCIGLFLTCASATLVFHPFTVAPNSNEVMLDRPHVSTGVPGDARHATIRTPMSLVDADTGDHLHAWRTPLYDELKTTEFVDDTKARRNGNRTSQHDIVMELPTLSLDRTRIQIRDRLTLSWSLGRDSKGNALVDDDDILCLYCPASEHDPLKFREAATVAQAQKTSQKHGGNPEATEWFIPSFPILREESCQFRLYKKVSNDNRNNQQLHLMAESPILSTPDSKRTPTALHLAFTNATSEMLIHFVTGESGTPVAMYGMDAPNTKVEGTSQTYEAKDMCQEPANVTATGKFQPPGELHVVKMKDLEPNTTYQYKVGLASGQGITWSDVHSFHTAPPVGDATPFSFVAYGDQGCPSVGWGDGGLWTAGRMKHELQSSNNESHLPITQVHHIGDLSYARGAAHIWDEWFHMIQVFAARIPLMVGVGNHEYDHTAGGDNKRDPSGVNSTHGFMPSWGNYGDDSGGECGVPISKRFQMPATGNGVFWYSHDYASLHSIMLSSEHDMTKGSPQHKWLEADLKAVNRKLTPWVIVKMHRPMYHSEVLWDQNMVGMGLRYEIEDVIYHYKVDLVLTAHYHSYLRTCDGLYQSRCDNGGPTHITIGTAGAYLDSGTLYEQDWTKSFRDEHNGYGRITIMNNTDLHFEFVKAGAKDDQDSGSVLDDVWIHRDRQLQGTVEM